MISRAGLVARTCTTALARRQGVRGMAHHEHHHHPAHFKLPTMNDLPIPAGSWQEAYNAKQQKYNIQLLASAIIFGATLGYVVYSDIIDFNLPPKMKN